MKKIMSTGMALLLFSIAFGQYTVTKVIGQVTNKNSGETLRPGSRLRDDDMLAFSSPDDKIRVIVSGKGVYIISPNPASAKENNAIVEMLKSALKIKSREGYLSGRSEEDELLPGVLKTDAALNSFNLIEAENKYLFDRQRYDVSSGNQFFLQVEAPGAKPVIKPLKTAGDTLIIFAADLKTDPATYKLGFFNREQNRSQVLAEIKPRIDTAREMESMLRIYVLESGQKNKQLLERSSYEEIYEALGKPSIIAFRKIFDAVYQSIRE